MHLEADPTQKRSFYAEYARSCVEYLMRTTILLITTFTLIFGGVAVYGAKTFAEANARAQEDTMKQIEELAQPRRTAIK